MSEQPLEEREGVLAALREAREGSSGDGGGRLVIVSGPAGIGKSRVLARFAEDARAAGADVLQAAGSEHEMTLAHGVTRRLLERRLVAAREDERLALLDGPAALGWPLFTPAAGDVPEGPALLHGLYWLVANLSDVRTVTVVVDDVQWVDDPSLELLLYLVHRLSDLALTVVLGLRTGEPHASRPAVVRVTGHHGADVRHLEPLGEAAVGRVVSRQLGDADAGFVTAAVQLTGGNPFLLTELVRACRDHQVAARDDAVRQLRRLAPENVLRAIVARLSRLEDPAAAVARAVAVLGPDATMRRVGLVAAVDPDMTTRAVDALVAADVLAPGEPLGFVHPLTRSAVYDELSFGARARGHARAAEVVHDDGAAAERVAAHLQLTVGDGQPWRVEVLRQAARMTAARGAPTGAVAHLDRALAEPPAPGVRRDVLLELGLAELRALAPGALEHLEAALELTSEPESRVEVQLAIGSALRAVGRGRDAALMLREAAESLGPGNVELAERLRCEFLGEAMLDETLAPAAWAEVSERVALRGGTWTEADRPLLAQFSLSAVVGNGDRAAGLDAARGLLSEPGYLERESAESQMYWMAVASLSWGDALEDAERACDAAVDHSVRSGSVLGFAWASYARAWPRYWRGDLAGAEADAEAAVDVWTSDNAVYLPAAVAWLAHARIDRGAIDAAADAVGRVEQSASVVTPQFALLRWARARVARLEGRLGDAMADLEAAGAASAASRIVNPGTCPWRSEAARVALASGDRRRALELAHEELALARSFGAPRQIGIALRAAGLAEGGAAGVELLTEAVRVLDGHPARLELAHTLVLLGGAERRAGSRAVARGTLRTAIALCDRLGAVLLADEAREELRAAGGHAVERHADGLRSLTPSERRVAEYAARGLSNREIAHALFVTRKTVEFHLSRAYAKLGITSRRELASALGESLG